MKICRIPRLQNETGNSSNFTKHLVSKEGQGFQWFLSDVALRNCSSDLWLQLWMSKNSQKYNGELSSNLSSQEGLAEKRCILGTPWSRFPGPRSFMYMKLTSSYINRRNRQSTAQWQTEVSWAKLYLRSCGNALTEPRSSWSPCCCLPSSVKVLFLVWGISAVTEQNAQRLNNYRSSE